MSGCGDPPDAFNYGNTLAAKLGGCVDKIRGINAMLGLRPYHVYLVHTRWSGTEVGDGVESVLTQEEVLPVPRVQSIASLRLQLQSVGLAEIGDLQLSEVSTRYTENRLRRLQEDGTSYPRNESTYWEIHFLRADGSNAIRRRFVCVGVPVLEPGNVQWTVSLSRSYNDRDSTTGTPR